MIYVLDLCTNANTRCAGAFIREVREFAKVDAIRRDHCVFCHMYRLHDSQ